MENFISSMASMLVISMYGLSLLFEGGVEDLEASWEEETKQKGVWVWIGDDLVSSFLYGLEGIVVGCVVRELHEESTVAGELCFKIAGQVHLVNGYRLFTVSHHEVDFPLNVGIDVFDDFYWKAAISLHQFVFGVNGFLRGHVDGSLFDV